MSRLHNNGFTIVELLIVIVVIGVLSSVTAVAYNGVSQRANYSVAKQNFSAALKAIELYKQDKGYYPDSENCASGFYHVWCGFNQGTDNGFIPGIVPDYASTVKNLDPSLPNREAGGGGDTLLYMSRAANGTSSGTAEFNLIRYRNVEGQGLSQNEIANNPMLMTTNGYQTSTQNFGWGYRSNPSHEWY